MLRTLSPLLLVAGLVAGCATAPVVVERQDAWLATLGQVVRSESAPGAVLLRSHADEVRIGDAVVLDVLPRRSGYLYVYHLGTNGSGLSLLFPNASDSANFVNGAVRLPRAGWRMTARGPDGVGHFLAVLTEERQDLQAQGAALRAGSIPVQGRYAASMVQVRELP